MTVDKLTMLVNIAGMKLRKYLDDEKITPAAFADMLGVKVQTVYRYLHDQRVPTLDMMKKIAKATDSAVQANDFFDRAETADAEAAD